MNFAIAIADVDVDGAVLEFFEIKRAAVREDEVADVDISADVGVFAIVHEADHLGDVVEEAEAARAGSSWSSTLLGK